MTEAQANAGTMSTEEPKKNGTRGLGGAWEAVSPVLVALVTGVGLLAFVALFGGAILWDRAEQAGLPGTEAVALMPRSLLLATGAHFLVGALLLAVIAVCVLWLIDSVLRTPEQIATEAKLEAADFALAVIGPAHLVSHLILWVPNKVIGRGGVDEAEKALAEAIAEQENAKKDEEAKTQAVQTMQNLTAEERENRQKAQSNALGRLDEANAEVGRAQDHLADEIIRWEERKNLLKRAIVLTIALLFGEALLVIVFHPPFDQQQEILLVLASVGTSLIALAVYQVTQKFSWFAVVVFLGVAAVQGVATHFTITSHPKVEPAAVLINRLPPIAGVYVAQTDDWIYLGVSREAVGEDASLVAIPRGRVIGLAVGGLRETAHDAGKPSDADQLAAELGEILCSQVPKPKTPKERRELPLCPNRPAAGMSN
jgi:hypothetical protein